MNRTDARACRMEAFASSSISALVFRSGTTAAKINQVCNSFSAGHDRGITVYRLLDQPELPVGDDAPPFGPMSLWRMPSPRAYRAKRDHADGRFWNDAVARIIPEARQCAGLLAIQGLGSRRVPRLCLNDLGARCLSLTRVMPHRMGPAWQALLGIEGESGAMAALARQVNIAEWLPKLSLSPRLVISPEPARLDLAPRQHAKVLRVRANQASPAVLGDFIDAIPSSVTIASADGCLLVPVGIEEAHEYNPLQVEWRLSADDLDVLDLAVERLHAFARARGLESIEITEARFHAIS